MTASWGSLFDRAESHDVDREAIRAALERRRDVPGDDGPGDDGSATNGRSDDGPSDDGPVADDRGADGSAMTGDGDG